MQNSQRNDKNEERITSAKNKKVIILMSVLVVCLAVLVVVLFCYIGFSGCAKGESAEKESRKNTYENEKEYKDEDDENAHGKTIEHPQNITLDIEAEVEKIRTRYDDMQANLDLYVKVEGDNGVVRYYDDGGTLARIDVPADSSNSYTRYYYLSGDELYFAFVFDGLKENRLYFYDEMLFRWQDEEKQNHDNETSNKDFINWENKCIEEVTRLK